ncbi:hypothetical protein D7D52_31790 [Nocardia yunnanensis]|uniref:Uncharacterized protein n=1 Tax=Nocardia yunnanensis TaxID=2382165 RepID=A0A386ZJP0_9NOCA|nr:hypothetical protein [Nocardia yunnanensis]AYF77638.1 hypothetical protein D7D52_31790 [Nocardia yunnanensis]
MADDRLTLSERCVMLVLMAEARELTNTELYAVAGVKLDGRYRRRLNELDLVASTLVNRAFVHELTDRGTLWCAAELSRERPQRSGCAGGALYSVLAGLGRHLDRTGAALSDLFQPEQAAGQVSVESAVEQAYAELTDGSGKPLRLSTLRVRLAAVPRTEVDQALETMARRRDVHVRAEADQKVLTAADHGAAIMLGGTARHLLTIEVPR